MLKGLIIKRINNSDLLLTAFLFLFLMFLVGTSSLSGQPIKIILTVERGLNFGEFYPTTGGPIVINSTGDRSVPVGGVVLLPGGSVHQCVVNVNTDKNNRDIFINVETPVQLARDGGGSMTLDLVATPSQYKSSNQNPDRKINIGGTLHVGNIMSNPPGNYNGTFTITVNGQ